MPLPQKRLQLVALLAVLAASGCATLETTPPVGVQLSGTWQLNQSLSNGLSALSTSGLGASGGAGRGMRRSRGGGSGGGGGDRMPGGGMGGGGSRPAGNGAGGDFDPAAADPGSRERVAGPPRPKLLVIDQTSKDFKLVADGASEHFVYGAKATTPFANGKADTQSGWEADSFVVKQKIEKGPQMTRTYERAADSDQMIVETTIKGVHGPERKFVSLYERVAKTSAP